MAASSVDPDALHAAINAAIVSPLRDELWDVATDLARALDDPDPVTAAFREVLSHDLTVETMAVVGRRAVAWHDEWSGEPAPLEALLSRVLSRDPGGAVWAFDRLALLLSQRERWTELLALYDRAIDTPGDETRRRRLLDEAARLARDFAGEDERAIAYLQRVRTLSNEGTSSALERLLADQGRHGELVELWRATLPTLPVDEARVLRARIASHLIEPLDHPAAAVTELESLLRDGASDTAAPLLERIVVHDRAPRDVRSRAASLLRAHFAATDRGADVARVIEHELSFTSRDERASLLSELVTRRIAEGRLDDAVAHQAELVALAAPDALERMRELSERAGAHAAYADALVTAADAQSGEGASRFELLSEAARVRRERANDARGASSLYLRVLAAPDAPRTLALEAARRLDTLLEGTEATREQVEVLFRLADLEPGAAEARAALGRAARAASRIGDIDRACSAWQTCVERDPSDREALDALIAQLESAERWDALVEALRRRVTALPAAKHTAQFSRKKQRGRALEAIQPARYLESDAERRADLVRIARIEATSRHAPERAADAWREVEALFGQDAETLTARIELASQRAQWDELASLLERAAERERDAPTRGIDVLCRLGAVLRDHVQDTARATACFARVLAIEPADETARAALRAMVGDEPAAVAALARAYTATGDWTAMLEIREPRLAIALQTAERAAIQMESAEIEERAGDLAAAARSVKRAFAVSPGDPAIEREVLRLAEARGDWSSAVDAYRDAIAALDDEATRLELEMRAADVLESRAGDRHGALEGFLRVHRARPERLDAARAVARLASQLGAWDTTASALVTTSLARHAVDPELVQAVENLAHETHAWDAACAGLRTALEPTTDRADRPEVLAALWATLGRWHRDHRSDHDAARDAYARAVRADGRDAAALRSLAELQRRAPDRALVDTLLALADAERHALGVLFEAARVALESLGDAPLGRSILERLRDRAREMPGEVTLVERLVASRPELPDDADERVERRLTIALWLRALGDRDGGVEALRTNLAEIPGHAGSVRALADLLTVEGDPVTLAELYASQAARLESLGEKPRASVLFARAGDVLERLDQSDRAIAARRRAVELSRDPSPESLDALARLHAARGEHADAAAWLERLADATREPDARAAVATRLAHAWAASGEPALAESALERLLTEQPASREARTMLAEIHRGQQSWARLAAVLVDTVDRVSLDAGEQLAMLREAGSLRHTRLDDAAGAVELFERAVALAPADAPTRLALGEALADAGRADEARVVLEALSGDYGRRRPPARAQVHFALARIARGAGRLDEALGQLDAAVAIDVDNARILRTLGDVALEAGAHDRAERAYRSLLLVLGRAEGAVHDVHRVDVLLALASLAERLEQTRRAREFLESAFELAAQDERESRALEQAFASSGRTDLQARVLRSRLAAAREPAQRADVLSRLADLLLATPGLASGALDARLDAVAAMPRSNALHDAAHALAVSVGEVERYAQRLAMLADEAETAADAGLCFDLLLRLGEVTERDLGRMDRAGEILARAERLDAGPIRVAFALERVYGALGDAVGQARVLQRLASTDDPDVDEARRADALCRLGEIQLGNPTTRGEGTRAIGDALDRAETLDDSTRRSINARASAVLSRAVQDAPDDTALLDLYERAARAHGESATLFDAIERRSLRPGAPASLAREAAEHALSLGEMARASTLLERVSESADAGDSAPWALAQRAQIARDAGDTGSAMALLRRAVDGGESLPEWITWATGLATLASADGGDLGVAAETYEKLRRREPMHRGYWEPLLEVYRRTGADDAREELIRQVADHVFDGAERNRLRMERARVLIERPDRWDEAVSALRYVLGENPADAEAAALLREILQRGSRDEELAELLARQFDAAVLRRDVEAVVSLALQLGALLARTERTQALVVYRRALDIVPAQPALLEALFATHRDEDPLADRVECAERLLAVQTGPLAAATAASLASWRESAGDVRGALEALIRGLTLCPGHVGLLSRLVRTSARGRAADARDAVAEVTRAIEQAPSPPAELLALRAEARAASGDDAGAVTDLELACAQPGGDAYGRSLVAAFENLRAASARVGDTAAEGEATLRLADRLRRDGQPDRAMDLLESWTARAPRDRVALRALIEGLVALERWDGVVAASRRQLEIEEGRERIAAVLTLADACVRLGRPDEARPELEWAHTQAPWDEPVRIRLRALYERLGAARALATLTAVDAEYAPDDAACFRLLVRAGDLWLHGADDAASALGPLEQATRLRPADPEPIALYAEALDRVGRTDEARASLQRAIDAYKGRRSRDVATLQHRMASLARRAGDRAATLAWLGSALENDMQNGVVASELADAALEAGDHDLALRGLRAVTLMKGPSPMGRAVAFLRQGEIAMRQRDAKKAAFFARKALSEDPTLEAAAALLREAGE